MDKTLITVILVVVGYFLGRYALMKYRLYRLKKDVWKKGYEEASSIDSLTVVQLINKGNERLKRIRRNQKK